MGVRKDLADLAPRGTGLSREGRGERAASDSWQRGPVCWRVWKWDGVKFGDGTAGGQTLGSFFSPSSEKEPHYQWEIRRSVNTNNLKKKPRKAKPKEASATLLQNCLVL